GRVRGVPALCDNDVVWLWRVVWHLVYVGTWSTPFHRVGLVPLKSAQASVHMPPRVGENGVPSVLRARRTSCFLLSTIYGIYAPERLCQCSHRPLHAASA